MIVQGMVYEDYHKKDGLRASHLHKLKISPQYFKSTINEPDKDTPSKHLGRLVHSLFENSEKFMDTYIVEPKFTGKTKDGRESSRSGEALQAKKEWYESLPQDAVVVTQDELNVLLGIANQIKNSKLLTAMLKNSIREASIFVEDEGLNLQCRPDFITESGYIVDIKTTRMFAKDFHHEIFSDKFNRRFYVLSAAHYIHCAKLEKLSKTDRITLLAVETFPPYGFIPYTLDIGCLGPGEQWRQYLTDIYRECIKYDIWPGYEDKIVGLTPPENVSLPPEPEL